MFKTALFIIAKTFKELGYPSVSEWINKLWYIQTMEHYSVLKTKQLSSHEKTQRNLKCKLSERNQLENTTHCMIPTIWYSQFSSVQFFSHVQLLLTPLTAARQDSLSISNSRSLLKLMSIRSVLSSNHVILCRPLPLPPSIFPSIRVFSNESGQSLLLNPPCPKWGNP